MAVPFCRLIRPDSDVSANDALSHAYRRGAWNFVVGGLKGIDWYGYGMPGWDAVYNGTFPLFSDVELTEEGATGRKIRYNFSYNAGVCDGITVEFDDNDALYTQIHNVRDDLLAGDVITTAPVYNYARPIHTEKAGGGETNDGDDFAMRENWLAMAVAALTQNENPENYQTWTNDANLHNVAVTKTTDTDGLLTQVDWNPSTSTANLRALFTYYDADLYDDDTARVRTLETLVQRDTGESYLTIDKMLYLRRANGAVSRIESIL